MSVRMAYSARRAAGPFEGVSGLVSRSIQRWTCPSANTSRLTMTLSGTEQVVNDRLRDIMVNSFREVLKLSMQHKVNMRTAAYMVAISRVATVHRLRGIYA